MSAEHSESPIPDEAWEKFQLESEGPARLSAPKEPSARARMVTERLRQADEQAARRGGRVGRRWRREPVRAEPEAWRSWSGQQRAGKRRSRIRGLVWVVLAVAVVLVVLNPDRALSWLS
ncbi:hypothetical protein [Streptomyces sp. NPDC020681]|uniref:hypothetical protein n=1 Tax=Streptomyces sp. NPDC020681 TaxID=3365083 RepID=UPI0037A040BC